MNRQEHQRLGSAIATFVEPALQDAAPHDCEQTRALIAEARHGYEHGRVLGAQLEVALRAAGFAVSPLAPATAGEPAALVAELSAGEVQVLELVLSALLRGGDPSQATRSRHFAGLCRKVVQRYRPEGG